MHVVLKGPCEFNKVTCSENYSCKCEANQKFLSQILLRKKARYVLAYSYVYELDFSYCGQALYLTVSENLGLYLMV